MFNFDGLIHGVVIIIVALVITSASITSFIFYNLGYVHGEKAATISTLEGNPPFELVHQKDGSTEWQRVKE
jgi:hypothetical protein